MKRRRQIRKAQVGRPGELRSLDGRTYGCVLEQVANRYATIRYWVPEKVFPEGYVIHLPVTTDRVTVF